MRYRIKVLIENVRPAVVRRSSTSPEEHSGLELAVTVHANSYEEALIRALSTVNNQLELHREMKPYARPTGVGLEEEEEDE